MWACPHLDIRTRGLSHCTPRPSPFHIVQRIAYFQEIRRNSLIGCVCVSFCVSLLIRFGIDYEPVANLSRIIRGGTGKYGYLRCGHALFKCRYPWVHTRTRTSRPQGSQAMVRESKGPYPARTQSYPSTVVHPRTQVGSYPLCTALRAACAFSRAKVANCVAKCDLSS